MVLTKCVFEIEDCSLKDLQDLGAFLESRKVKSTVLQNSLDAVNNDNFTRLENFIHTLTQKQRETWDYFVNNPGKVIGENIRRDLPILSKQGSLPAVFKASRRWIKLYGPQFEMDCPFYKLHWNIEKQCGEYRGLTVAEAKYISSL